MTTSTSVPKPLTTVYTLPTSCATRWVEFGLNTLYRDEVHASLGAYGSNCWPPSYNVAKYSFYSPGVCPDQWTVATVSSAASQLGQYSAHCCPSGYSFDSLCQSSLPPTTTPAYSIGKLTAAKNATTTKSGLIPSTAIQYALPTGGMAKIDGVPIQWASSDIPQLPAAATAQLIAAMSQLSQPTQAGSGVTATTTVTSSAGARGSSSLSVGAKAGMGAGIGASGLFLFIGLLLYWVRVRKRRPIAPVVAARPKTAKKPGTPVMELEGDSKFPQELPAKPPQIDWIPGEKGPRVLSGHFFIDKIDEKKEEAGEVGGTETETETTRAKTEIETETESESARSADDTV